MDGDLLATSTTGTLISASYNSATETLVLSGSDTLADYQTVLDKVTFNSGSNPDDFGSQHTRTVTWVLNDGSGSNNLSTSTTETINVTAVNDPPALTGTANTALPRVSAHVAQRLITDPDSLNLGSATVHIAGGTFAGDGDVLATSVAGTSITASYNAATETLTLTGSDSLAHYQSVLDKITFNSTSDNPDDFGSNPTRTVTWLLNDGSGSNNLSSVVTTTVNVTAVNDPPTLTGTTATVAFTENAAPVALSPSVTVSDPDSLTLAGASVHITGGTFTGDGDVLAANTSGTLISASYNAATETLVLSGSDTLADYQQVLDSVTFVTPSDNPTNFGSAPTRTVTWVLDDGAGSSHLSAAATTTVSITAVNDPPTLSNMTASAGYTEGAGQVALLERAHGHRSGTAPGRVTSATVHIVGGTFFQDGDLLTANATGTSITASANAGDRDADAHRHRHAGALPTGARFGRIRIDERQPGRFRVEPDPHRHRVQRRPSGSSNLSSVATTTLNVTAVNDPPTLTGTAASAAFTENGAAVTLSNAVTVADPDSQNLASATVAITGGTFAGDGDVLAANTTGTLITASYDATSETLTLTGSDTLADYRQVLDSVTFNSTSDNPDDFGADPTRTVTWVLNDGLVNNQYGGHRDGQRHGGQRPADIVERHLADGRVIL